MHKNEADHLIPQFFLAFNQPCNCGKKGCTMKNGSILSNMENEGEVHDIAEKMACELDTKVEIYKFVAIGSYEIPKQTAAFTPAPIEKPE